MSAQYKRSALDDLLYTYPMAGEGIGSRAREELAALRAAPKLYHDAWSALDEIMVQAGLIDKKAQPENAQRVLRIALDDLNDWREAAKAAAREKCDGGERHCTCVGPLRGQLAALRELVERADAVMEGIAGVECRRASCASDGEDYVDERGHDAVHEAKRAYLEQRKKVGT